MPREKDFKRQVRRRMDRTGERYTRAREQLRAGGDPIEWTLGGEAYEWSLAEDAAPGDRVDVLRCVGDPGAGFGVLSHTIAASELGGRRVRFSALVRGEDVEASAGLWLRVDGPERKVLAHDQQPRRPLRGTSDWQPLELVLDVAPEAERIAVGAILRGRGALRLAAPRLEAVDESVAVTGRTLVDGWGLTGSRWEAYEVVREECDTPAGRRDVAVLRSTGDPGSGFGATVRTVPAVEYRGGRLRLSALVQGDDVGRMAGLWMRLDAADGRMLALDNMQSRPLEGTFGWQEATVVLDVPDEAAQVVHGLILSGTGAVRITGARLEAVDESVATTLPTGRGRWTLAGSRPQAYELLPEPADAPGGRPGALVLRTVGDPGDGFGTMSQGISAEPHRGRRVRLRATVRGQYVADWAGLWMRVDGRARPALAFDNMQDRPLRGTFDWRSLAVVLDVPDEATSIAFGVLMVGTGAVHVVDADLEAVGEDVPVTQPRLPGWAVGGTRPGFYGLTFEQEERAGQARRVAVIRPVDDPDEDASFELFQTIDAAGYAGGTVRLRASMRGEGVSAATMHGALIDAAGAAIGEPMFAQPLEGTFDWRTVELDLPVAPEAAAIAFGFQLRGRGTLRVTDVGFEAPEGEPAARPRNLDFHLGA